MVEKMEEKMEEKRQEEREEKREEGEIGISNNTSQKREEKKVRKQCFVSLLVFYLVNSFQKIKGKSHTHIRLKWRR